MAATPAKAHSAMNAQRCTIIRGDVAKGIPTIIYMPLLKNEKYSDKFCPRQNALTKGGYCSTFNFQYKPEEVMELSGLTRANMIDSKEQIVRCFAEVSEALLAFHASK
jgi:glycine cleavage system pyridoxal-binding protein P